MNFKEKKCVAHAFIHGHQSINVLWERLNTQKYFLIMMGMKGVWRKDDTFKIKRRHMRQQLKKKDKKKIILHQTKQGWQYFQQCLAITLFDARVWYQEKQLQFWQMEEPHINSLMHIWWRKGIYILNHWMASQYHSRSQRNAVQNMGSKAASHRR